MNDKKTSPAVDQATEYLLIYGCAFPIIVSINVTAFALLAWFLDNIGLL